jgi:hypothetical protein
VQGQYIDDSRCDPVPNIFLPDELGHAAFFPLNESINTHVIPFATTVCVPNDGIANDWSVAITNVSGIPWQDVHFVANPGYTIGNSDGMVVNFANPAVLTDAFRVDASGANNSLAESFAADGVFAPGETWRFLVSNFIDPSGGNLPPSMISPGLFAGTGPSTVDSASILAVPIPEPASLGVMAVAGAGVLTRRRRTARS